MTRELLPNRRHGETLDFRYGQFKYTANIGRYPDGRIGEIFLRSGLIGTDMAISCQESAISVSFALQYGATIDQMREAMPRTTVGSPEGVIGKLLDILSKGEL